MNDKISDLIINIKNASMARKISTEVPFSKIKKEILKVLKKESYISDFSELGDGVKKRLKIDLSYNQGKAKINDVKRISKLSKRVYYGFRDIFPVKYGYGLMILSTPEGIKTDKEARKEKVGGEALFKIW